MLILQINEIAKMQGKFNGGFRQTELWATHYHMSCKLFTRHAAYAINKQYSVTDTLFVLLEVIHGIKSREY